MNAKLTLFEKASEEWEAGNLRRAFDLFQRAAELGDASSQNNLGYFFDEGIGVNANKEKAKFWYTKAMKNGEISSYSNLAKLQIDDGDFAVARDLLGKAISLGDGDAALELAKLYLDGSLQDENGEAKKYLKLALQSDSVTHSAVENARSLLAKI